MDIDREALRELLLDLHPEVDYDTHTRLIEEGIIDSFDLVCLIGDIKDRFGVVIYGEEIVPENFNSLDAIWRLLVQKGC